MRRLPRWGMLCLCLLWWGGGFALPVPCSAADGQSALVPPTVLPGLPRLLPVAPGTAQECGDPLAAADIRPAGLEFLFCRREDDGGQPRLTARYRVRGSEAARVEEVLRERCRMGALVRSLGIWNVQDGEEGRLDAAALRAVPPGETVLPDGVARVSMGEVPQLGVFAADRTAWKHIMWFAVRVDIPLVGPGRK